ncbi:predicted protein [Naegleria gruberi]|uniref:Predicted protein n=1 Tax=Naegleria gruberi TaxID=5762 RepID=D2W1J7_NAEGR|nr:uncharacterized protein NAEGRDRAFT_75245 [Naegleria gruberi]EFC37058.1 predicted protein [Naegleria gruberi]|eukprot:XP_002669802.1 predicted protein [Naegleria gruberi strain NEG-M]
MDQFKIERDGGYIFIKYKHAISMKDTFPDPNDEFLSAEERLNYQLRRECRGIVFRNDQDDDEVNIQQENIQNDEKKVKGRIISRKFHKFFNINEREESNVESINWRRGFIVMEKMDGSLVSPLRIIRNDDLNDGIEDSNRVWTFTSMLGFTETGQAVDEFIYQEMEGRKRDKLFELCEYCEESGITPLFEFCSKENKVVIEHEKTSLILLAFRNIESGEYMSFKDTVNTLNKFNNPVPIVKLWKEYPNGLKGVEDANKLLKEIYAQKNVEGYVIRFYEGDMYKVKTTWYTSLHGLETTGKFIRDRHVIKGILENNVDDIISSSFFNGEEKKRKALQLFRDEVERRILLKIAETTKELKEKSIDDISPDSITGKFYYYLTSEHPQEAINNSDLITSVYYSFLIEYFKLNGREFDRHRKLFYKYLSIDFSVMKPYHFTHEGILSEPSSSSTPPKKQAQPPRYAASKNDSTNQSSNSAKPSVDKKKRK